MSYWRTYVGRVLARLGSGVPVDSATYALHGAFADPASWAVFPDVPETLAELRSRGLRLGVISNWDSRLPRLLQGLGLDSFFEPVVHSSRVGHEKPSPEIFHEALRQARARPEESIHVGDESLPTRFEFGAQHLDHLTQLAHLGPRLAEIIVRSR